MYVYDLIINLRAIGFGCYLFGEYVGCILHSNDIILLPTSVKQLYAMLDKFTQYANDNQLMFNNLKSYAVAFHKSANIDNLPKSFLRSQ